MKGLKRFWDFFRAARPFSVLVLVSVYLVVAGHVLQIVPNELLQVLEGYAYNERLRLFPAKPVVDPVVIVDIDEKSLAELGRWPWTRVRLAQLVDQLFDRYQIHTIGLDILLSEPESDMADSALAKAFEGRRVVAGYHFSTGASTGDDKQKTAAPLPEADLPADVIAHRYSFPVLGNDSLGILDSLLEMTADSGHIHPHLDSDGVTRRVPALIAFGEGLYTSLSIAVVRTAIGGAGMQVDALDQRVPGAAVEWIELANQKQSLLIPVDRQLMMQIPFRGPPKSFPYVSAVDVMKGSVDPSLLRGKIVLLGTSAAGLYDLRNTPVSSEFPGVEIHANAVSAILNQQLLHQPAWIDAWQLIVLAVVMLLSLIVMGYASPIFAFTGLVLIVAALCLINVYWWSAKFWVVPLAPTLFGILLGVGAALMERWFVALRQSRRVENTFARYVPKEVARRLAKDPDKDLMRAREYALVIMFTDIAGFTGLARKLQPQQIAEILREVLTPLSATIHEHQGTIDKYIGDAVMAFWGAPLEVRDAEQQALSAALEMVKRIAGLQEVFRARDLPAIGIGIGIHSGKAYVGDMGSSFRSTYTAIGDDVNLSARIEGLTRVYGVGILVTEPVKLRCESRYMFRFVDRVIVKGYDIAVSIYEPLADLSQISPQQHEQYESLIRQWDEAFAMYEQGDWEEARLAMLRLFAHPRLGGSAKALLHRIDVLEENPPPRGWTGVWLMNEK